MARHVIQICWRVRVLSTVTFVALRATIELRHRSKGSRTTLREFLQPSVRQSADVSMIVAATAAGKRASSVAHYRTGIIILFRNLDAEEACFR